jgi:hypothetical protein
VYDLVWCINIGESSLSMLYFWAAAKQRYGARCIIGRQKQCDERRPKILNPMPKTNFTAWRVCAVVEDALRICHISNNLQVMCLYILFELFL